MIMSCLLDSLDRMVMFGIIFEPVMFIWCVSLQCFYGGMLLHAFADSGSCISYICCLHTSTGCLVAGIHEYNVEGVCGFIRVVFYEQILAAQPASSIIPHHGPIIPSARYSALTCWSLMRLQVGNDWHSEQNRPGTAWVGRIERALHGQAEKTGQQWPLNNRFWL